MKIENNVALLWVNCFDYQSNTLILGELDFNGRSSQFAMLVTNVIGIAKEST